MARKCACEKLFEYVEREPRFTRVGLAARMLFISIMRLITEHGDGMAISFGSDFGFKFGSLNAVASWLRISETEFETELLNLTETGLLKLDSNSISRSLELSPAERRAAIARENGRKSRGRPPKNAQPLEQRWMALPIAGGLQSGGVGETQETESETQAKPELEIVPSAGSTTSSFSERESSTDHATDEAPWVSLGRELASILQLDPNGKHRFDIVKGWLEAGAGVVWLKDVFREVMARKSPPPHPSFSYLDKVIRPRLRISVARSSEPEAASPQTDEQRVRSQEWSGIYARWEKEGFTGPVPPKRKDWIFGEVGDRARWLLYRTMGPAAFRQAA